MPIIEGVDGKKYDYADYEDKVKYALAEQMRREYFAKSSLKCSSCSHHLTEREKEICMGLCPKCGRDSLVYVDKSK